MQAITIPNLTQLEKFKTLTIVVNSPDTETQARSYLTDVRLASKRLDVDVKLLKRPHQDFIKDIDEAARPWKTILSERDQSLERALLEYGRMVRLAAEEANRKILERYEKKVDKVEAKAILENKPMPVVLPPQMVATPQKSVETDGSRQTTVKRKQWRMKPGFTSEMSVRELFAMRGITNLDEMWPEDFPGPDYFFLDSGMIGKIVRSGGKLSGVDIYDEESISVKA